MSYEPDGHIFYESAVLAASFTCPECGETMLIDQDKKQCFCTYEECSHYKKAYWLPAFDLRPVGEKKETP